MTESSKACASGGMEPDKAKPCAICYGQSAYCPRCNPALKQAAALAPPAPSVGEPVYAECYVCGRPMDGLSEADCHCFHRKELLATPPAAPADHIADASKKVEAPAATEAPSLSEGIAKQVMKLCQRACAQHLDYSNLRRNNWNSGEALKARKAYRATLDEIESLVCHLATPAPAVGASPEPLQPRVQPWLMECFGPMIAGDREERNHRFLEESLELVQACGCSASEAHQLVDYVFGRPVGEKDQEVGGVMITLAALCLANGLDMHDAGERELARIWTMVEKIRAKQAAKPKHSPLPVAVGASVQPVPASLSKLASELEAVAASIALPNSPEAFRNTVSARMVDVAGLLRAIPHDALATTTAPQASNEVKP